MIYFLCDAGEFQSRLSQNTLLLIPFAGMRVKVSRKVKLDPPVPLYMLLSWIWSQNSNRNEKDIYPSYQKWFRRNVQHESKVGSSSHGGRDSWVDERTWAPQPPADPLTRTPDLAQTWVLPRG